MTSEKKLKIFTEDEWKYFCTKINWGNTFLDDKAVRIMNKPLNQKKEA